MFTSRGYLFQIIFLTENTSEKSYNFTLLQLAVNLLAVAELPISSGLNILTFPMFSQALHARYLISLKKKHKQVKTKNASNATPH